MIYIFLFVIITAFCISAVAMFLNKRYIGTTLLTLLLVIGSLGLIAKNDNDHLGMHVTESTTTTKLASSYRSQLPFLVYKQLGTTKQMSERVYSYRIAGQSKRQQTKLDHFQIRVIRKNQSGGHAKLVKTVKQYQYKNNWWHGLFLGSKAKRTKSTSYVFEVPQDWLVLESKQAKRLPTVAKKLQAQATQTGEQAVKHQVTQLVTQQVKAQAPAAVTAQVKAQVSADPAVMQNQTQYRALQQRVTAQVTANLTRQVTKQVETKQLPQIKRQVTAKAKSKLIQTLRQELE
ncbi:DUF4811 domain-containing protein [Secundilactobacillus hailunensis]|uniref:DUF4811 domain-containing protein n=1 Tax=Secundilactobacillus hailunensis TaxID=2559923 RepID=A0ABW1TBI8_9LACO|nr:DUF4811 domain-containing protein [Secundilactobacillus hailunensis]